MSAFYPNYTFVFLFIVITIIFKPTSAPDPKHDAKEEAAVDEVKRSLLQLATSNPDDFDPEDVEKVRNNYNYVWRFLDYQDGNKKAAVNQLVEMMKWRKQTGINHLGFADMPKEFFLTGITFLFGHDKTSRPVMYWRGKVYEKDDRFERILTNMSTILFDEASQLSNYRGITIVFDWSDVPLAKVPFGMIKNLASFYVKYCPDLVEQVLFLNFPLFLQVLLPFFRIILGKAASRIKVIEKSELTKYISRENLPQFMAGTASECFNQPPEESTRSFVDFGDQYDITLEEAKKYIELYKNAIEETSKLC